MELGHRTSKPIPIGTHFLQYDHTYSNIATPPNIVPPWAKYIQTTTGELEVFRTGLIVFIPKEFAGKSSRNVVLAEM
jgi:hypothetical protein